MRRSDEAFHKKLHADLDRFAGTYKAVFDPREREISLGDEPFKFLGLCWFDELWCCYLPCMFIPFIGCTIVNVSPKHLESYTITINPPGPQNYQEEVIYGNWHSCYFGQCPGGYSYVRIRDTGDMQVTGVGEAKDNMYKSVVRLTLVEANENELRYRRKGKDATAVFDAEGSRAASLARTYPEDPEIFQEWLEENKKRPFWSDLSICEDSAPPDKRILDIDGEMVVRDGEIVLTESVDGREPFTITLKKQ